MSQRNQHVVPAGDGRWALKGAGSSRATKKFETQRAAIEAGRQVARNQSSELLIHGRDGRIREKSD